RCDLLLLRPWQRDRLLLPRQPRGPLLLRKPRDPLRRRQLRDPLHRRESQPKNACCRTANLVRRDSRAPALLLPLGIDAKFAGLAEQLRRLMAAAEERPASAIAPLLTGEQTSCGRRSMAACERP